MPLLGQSSGGWSESSSSLRILHLGIRNTVGVLTTDAFTQTNPSMVTATSRISSNVDSSVLGVLSGSVAFTRPDGGANQIGGNIEAGVTAVEEFNIKPLGLFINNAVGHAYENTPGPASGKGPYVSGQGTFGNSLFETNDINGGGALTYAVGDALVCSLNGYLTNVVALNNSHERTEGSEPQGADTNTVIGILKMPADATQNELVYDQRI